MSSSLAVSNLELKGSLQEDSFAELLREIAEAKLSGSLRLSQELNKVVVYLKDGQIVFAVSNSRRHRLFEIILQSGKITENSLAEIKDFTNDFVLGEALAEKGLMTKDEINAIFAHQIEEILKSALDWKTGEWAFSPLARIKETICFDINWTCLLMNYARNLAGAAVIRRFRSFEESFGLNGSNSADVNLLPREAFILSRFGNSLIRVKDIKNLSGLSDTETLKTLYALWLGNFLIRRDWNSVFSENKINKILSARLSLIKEAAAVPVKSETIAPPSQAVKNKVSETSLPEEPKIIGEAEEKRLAESYLNRVEAAESYYEMLDVPVNSTVMQIKAAYFNLAKSFHPDKYHNETNLKLQQRIQDAFTEIARAYETLKDDSKRETYDYRLRKYLETAAPGENKKTAEAKANAAPSEKAAEEFDQGFNLLMNDEYEAALPFLIRAVQMSPNTAKYHAYYGKALSSDEKQRHKAESEIQTAIKLDNNNVTFRIMLVELYTQFGLLKRAEGELHRLLSQFPNNREAQVLLDSLSKRF